MAYEKQTWATGQVITAEKLNHMENGIEEADAGGGASPSTVIPSPLGTAAIGTSEDYARADHVHAMPSASDVGAYVKPSGGIPATDLATAVQTALTQAGTAVQTETDPTVPSWAKASTKPTYTASEVGAIPAPSSPATGAFLVWNGSAWVAQTLSTWSGGNY